MVVVVPVMMVMAPRGDDFLVVVVLCLGLGAEAHCVLWYCKLLMAGVGWLAGLSRTIES